MTVQTVQIAPATVKGIAMVGRVVTWSDAQYVVHSVEGRDWYAFDQDGTTVADLQMTAASWITEPVAMIIPSGHKIGDGWGVEGVALSSLRPGVCLSKAYR